MKRLIAVLTAAVLTLSVSGCGKENEKPGATLDVNLDLAYVSKELSFKAKYINLECSTEHGVLLSYTDHSAQKNYHAVYWNAETEEFTEISMHNEGKKHGSGEIIAFPDGRIGVVFQKTSSNQYRWEYEEDTYMDVYDSNLQYAETVQFNRDTGLQVAFQWLPITLNGETGIAYMYSTSSNRENSTYEILLLDSQMEYAGAISVPTYADMFQGASGELYVHFRINGQKSSFSRVDLENCKLESLNVTISPDYWLSDAAWSGRDVIRGTNGYEFYTYGERGICGVKLDGKTWQSEVVMDFSYSDYMPEDLNSSVYVIASPDGRFLINERTKDSYQLQVARPRTQEEKDELHVITMAGVDFNMQLKRIIRNYNRTHTDYHVFMIDYLQYVQLPDDSFPESEEDFNRHYIKYLVHGDHYTDPTDAAQRLQQDLIDGKVPDIICTDNLPFEQLASKGLFQDLSELMAADERFHEEDYVMSLFESMKYRGKLQSIAFSFYINTVVGKTKYVGEKQGLTPDEYIELILNRPEGMSAFQKTYREEYLEGFLPTLQSSFLDTETLTCTFDSPAFVTLLELSKTLPSIEDENKYEEVQKYTEFDEALLARQKMNLPILYRDMVAGYCNYEDMTLVGYPTVDGGNGCIFSAPYFISLNAKSKYQNEVWDIFMELLSEKMQRSLDADTATYSFPVLRSALEEDLDASTKGANRLCTLTSKQGDIYMGNNTEEDRAVLEDYIDKTTMFNYSDPQITDIIIEEAQMYLAGDQTAEEAAAMIQSRVNIYVSEQY